MILNTKNIRLALKLPKKKPKEGDIRVNITINDISPDKTYVTKNGSPITFIHYRFSKILLDNKKSDDRFRENFTKLLNILDRNQYEKFDPEKKKGIFKIKEDASEYQKSVKEYVLKAPGIPLEIYGASNPKDGHVLFADFYLAPLKPKSPDIKKRNRIMREINRL